MKRREKHLYRDGAAPAEERAFDERYGARGPEVYGAVVGKTAREEAAKRGGRKVERVRRHKSTTSRGKVFEVRQHEAIVVPEEEDRPRSQGGTHEVDGHYSGGHWVRDHRAKNPRRRRRR